MNPKVYIPQPIPDVALNRLKTMADVEVFPHLDRVIGPEDVAQGGQGEKLSSLPLARSPTTRG